MATLNDVAAAAGVSVSAVSRVLADSPKARVSAATRTRIIAAAAELDYRPNFAARALKSSRTHVLGLVMPDLTNAVFADFVRGAEVEADVHEYMVLLARAEGIGRSEAAIRKLIGEGRVDGVILQIHDLMPVEEVARLVQSGLPIVYVNSAQEDVSGSVVFDDQRAAALATEHLIGLGHRRIGMIGGLPTTGSAHRRHEGFLRAMRAAGLEPAASAVTWRGYERSAGGEAFVEVMAGPDRPTAVLVANLNAALGVLLEARERGIRVPDDVSVVAIHDAWTAEISWPPLTTVQMPWHAMGQESVRLLLDRIKDGFAPDETIVDPPPELVVRESTAPPR